MTQLWCNACYMVKMHLLGKETSSGSLTNGIYWPLICTACEQVNYCLYPNTEQVEQPYPYDNKKWREANPL